MNGRRRPARRRRPAARPRRATGAVAAAAAARRQHRRRRLSPPLGTAACWKAAAWYLTPQLRQQLRLLADEPVGCWAAPEEGCSRGEPEPLRSPQGVVVPHLEFSASRSLRRLVYITCISIPGAHEPARRVLRSATERHDRPRGAERGRAIYIDGGLDGRLGRIVGREREGGASYMHIYVSV